MLVKFLVSVVNVVFVVVDVVFVVVVVVVFGVEEEEEEKKKCKICNIVDFIQAQPRRKVSDLERKAIRTAGGCAGSAIGIIYDGYSTGMTWR